MTQPITTRGGWKARLGQIADAYPQAAGLLRRGTLARDLWSLSPHSPTSPPHGPTSPPPCPTCAYWGWWTPLKM